MIIQTGLFLTKKAVEIFFLKGEYYLEMVLDTQQLLQISHTGRENCVPSNS